MNPKISIITSTYNRRQRLEKAVNSVVEQTYPDWELLICDDGSTDDTETYAKALKDERIKYVKLGHFGNHSRPKNVGTGLAKGEYIGYLDDDNVYRPDHLAVLVKALDDYPTIDVVYADRWIVDETGEIKPRIGFTADYSPSLLMKANFIDTSDALIRRSAVFDVGGWDENYQKFLDWNLWCRMDKYGKKFKHIPLILTDYHLVKSSMSYQKLDSRDERTPAWDPYDCEIELPFLKKPKKPTVAIFSLTYDRLETTKVALESLYKTVGYDFDHYIVDNGSTDGTVEWLKDWASHENVHLILNKDNKGISLASNQALDEIARHKYDIIVKVDNDAVFKTQGWLAKMVEIWQSNHKIALSCYVSGLKDNPGGAQRFVYGQIRGEMIGMTRHLGGICHFVDSRAYSDFRWPTDETLHGNQDVEMSMSLNSKGYQMGYLENYFVSHGIGGTEQQMRDYPDYFVRRRWEKCHTYGEKYEETKGVQ